LFFLFVVHGFLCLLALPGFAQSARPAAAAPAPVVAPLRGSIEEVTVHGASLEGNLLGDSPDRHVIVYLPPSYASQAERRYPVLYLLHGFTDVDTRWFEGDKSWNLGQIEEKDVAEGTAKEMIIVLPNAFNKLRGAFYSTSSTTGDWEGFITRDLVSYVDQHYRTLARPESRGLAGHSMGGYGTLRIGLKHPEIYSSIYALSPCCIAWIADFHPGATPKAAAAVAAVHSFADLDKADFGTLVTFALAAAWSPDVKKPPFYLDLPVAKGVSDRAVIAKWSANMPVNYLDQIVPLIRQLHAIAFDAGTRDEFKSIPASLVELDRDLNNYRVAHTYETYDGTHSSNIPDRFATKVFPFFSKNLSFEK
jgi:S-formylglutathione hydrolase FrmB